MNVGEYVEERRYKKTEKVRKCKKVERVAFWIFSSEENSVGRK